MGVTNTRLSAVKRGVALEVARRIQRTTGAPVCIVGADPTDRDIERWMPTLLARTPPSAERRVRMGHLELRAVVLADQGLSIVTLSDRAVLEKVMPELRATFPFVVVDGPSAIGTGVGIARALWPMLDALLVTSGLRAGDLATTLAYVNGLTSRPSARHIDVGVVTTGDPNDSGLAPHQIERKLAMLPVIGSLPQLGERAWREPQPEDELDGSLEPIVRWIVQHRTDADTADPPGGTRGPLGRPPMSLAQRRYEAP